MGVAGLRFGMLRFAFGTDLEKVNFCTFLRAAIWGKVLSEWAKSGHFQA